MCLLLACCLTACEREQHEGLSPEDLPETFTVKEVMAVLEIEKNSAIQQCYRWTMHGFVERVKQGIYRKIIKEIMC